MKMHHSNNLEAGKLGFPTDRVVCKCILMFVTDRKLTKAY